MVYAGSGSGVALLGLRTRFRVVVGENLGLRCNFPINIRTPALIRGRQSASQIAASSSSLIRSKRHGDRAEDMTAPS
jgi:hypothetical protein